MTANINSFAMANGGQEPWWGIATKVDSGASVDEWAKLAGFDWTVEESPIYYRAGDSAHKASNLNLFYRSDRPNVVLGTGTDQFKPAQPREFLEFLHQFGQETDAKLETAGVLGEGEKFFVLLKTAQSDVQIMTGDGRTEDYVLGASANDGSMSTVFGPSRTRVVCQNTLQMALREGLDKLRINHRSRIEWKSVRAWLKREGEDFGLYCDLMTELSAIPVNSKQAAGFAKDLIAPNWDIKEQPRTPPSLRRFAETLQFGVGQAEAGQTAYGLVQAATRYVDHDKQARGQESRLNSALFGQGQTMKNNALDLVIRQCVEKWGERSRLQPVLAETKYASLLEAA